MCVKSSSCMAAAVPATVVTVIGIGRGLDRPRPSGALRAGGGVGAPSGIGAPVPAERGAAARRRRSAQRPDGRGTESRELRSALSGQLSGMPNINHHPR